MLLSRVDLFATGVEWRASKDREKLGSLAGVLSSIFVIFVTVFYAV